MALLNLLNPIDLNETIELMKQLPFFEGPEFTKD
jgi:hypothetical protein